MAGRSLILQSLIQPPPVFSLSLILLSPSSTTNFVVVLKKNFSYFLHLAQAQMCFDISGAFILVWICCFPFLPTEFFCSSLPSNNLQIHFQTRRAFSRAANGRLAPAIFSGFSLLQWRQVFHWRRHQPSAHPGTRTSTPGQGTNTRVSREHSLPPAPFPFYNIRISCDCYQKSKYFCIDNTITL